jgi:hypothetical protein
MGGDLGSSASQVSSGVVDIFATRTAMAAIKTDGSVVAWGQTSEGGDVTNVAVSNSVVTLFSTNIAFAALKTDGSVVAWGDNTNGGCISCASGTLAATLSSGVVYVYATYYAFAAVKTNGAVYVWGVAGQGGNLGSKASLVTSGVVSITSSWYAFAALKNDGSVVAWGAPGGDTSGVDSQLTSGVVSIAAFEEGFAAVKADGTVVQWGSSNFGGDSTSMPSSLSGVVKVFGTDLYGQYTKVGLDSTAAPSVAPSAAPTASPSAAPSTTQPSAIPSANPTAVPTALPTVTPTAVPSANPTPVPTSAPTALPTAAPSAVPSICPTAVPTLAPTAAYYLTTESYKAKNGFAFAARAAGGSLFAWGEVPYGGGLADESSLADAYAQTRSGVAEVVASRFGFTALKSNGGLVVWGAAGNIAGSENLGSNKYTMVVANEAAFAAINGTHLVAYGSKGNGGIAPLGSFITTPVISIAVRRILRRAPAGRISGRMGQPKQRRRAPIHPGAAERRDAGVRHARRLRSPARRWRGGDLGRRHQRR